MLQHQVQQLLLRNGNGRIESPNKQHQSTICEKAASLVAPNVLPNGINIRNGSTDSLCNGPKSRSSIGVMTSFLDNVNDAMPNRIQKFNERLKSRTQLVNEKFIDNVGCVASEEYLCKDSMLDKINDAIRNSSALIQHRTNGNTNGCVSPNRQSDINISAQAYAFIFSLQFQLLLIFFFKFSD